ncbi:hypothetical protein D9M68_473330 [compost metagenome]
MKREQVNSMAFSASALGRSSRSSTKRLSSDWRSGVSSAFSTPSSADMATISVGPIIPLAVSPANVSACTASRLWVPTSRRFLS